MAQNENPQHSEAKADVARKKARDPITGRFLNPQEQVAIASQQQQMQMSNERARLDQLFGRAGQPSMGQPPLVSQPMTQQNTAQGNIPTPQPNNNFQAILAANKPGSFTSPEQDADRWDTLLGKKRSNIRW